MHTQPTAITLFALFAALAVLTVLAVPGCGASPTPPPSEVLLAAKPSVSAVLWWLPPDIQTLTIARGPFPIPPIDARPDVTFDEISRALTLTLLRNLDGGRFLAGWTQLVLTDALDLRVAPNPALDQQPSAQILIFDQPISDRDWTSIEGAALDASVHQGLALLRLAPAIRGRAWSIWLARPTPHTLILSDNLPLLHTILDLRQSPDELALQPTHDAWRSLPSSPGASWSIQATDDFVIWTDISPSSPLTLRCDPAEACAGLPPQINTDADILVLLRTLGYWIPL